MRQKWIGFMLILVVLSCVGCGAKSEDAASVGTGGNSLPAATAEEDFASDEEEENSVIAEGYKQEDYLAADRKDLYSFGELLCGERNLKLATAYNENELLLCHETVDGATKTQTFTGFNPETGVVEVLGEITEEAKENADSYQVLCNVPLILGAYTDSQIRVYKEDFSGYRVVEIDKGIAMDFSVACHDGMMYYISPLSSELYRVELAAVWDGEENITLSQLEKESELLLKPDGYYGYYKIVNIDPEKNCLFFKVWDFENGSYCILTYHLVTGEIERSVTSENMLYYIWHDGTFETTLAEEYVEDGCQYTYGDWKNGQTYATAVDLMSYYDKSQEEAYFGLQTDPMLSVMDDYIVISVRNYTTDVVADLLLWKYEESEAAGSPMKPETEEIAVIRDADMGKVSERIRKLEEKYGINIICGENVPDSFTQYTISPVEDEDTLLSALDEIDRGLEVFPEGMFREMTKKAWNGYNIYLGTDFVPEADSGYIVAAGLAGVEYGYACIYIDVCMDWIAGTAIHETIHNIENLWMGMEETSGYSEEWDACNPEGYLYREVFDNYEGNVENTYYYEPDIQDAYFYNGYSKVNRNEDIAVTMEYFLDLSGMDYAYESQHLKEKVTVFMEYCYKYLECFKEDNEYLMKERYELLQNGWVE